VGEAGVDSRVFPAQLHRPGAARMTAKTYSAVLLAGQREWWPWWRTEEEKGLAVCLISIASVN
jgi:hypothetical protein